MNDLTFSHLLVPIAHIEDAERTCDELNEYLDSTVEVLTVVFVIEKREGYMDPAPPRALEQEAEKVFSYVEDYFGDGPNIQRELRYGTDVVQEIIDTADEYGVSAICFTPRPKSKLQHLLSENTSYRLMTESDHPVLVFSKGNTGDK